MKELAMESTAQSNSCLSIHTMDHFWYYSFYFILFFTSNPLQINTFVWYNKKEILEKKKTETLRTNIFSLISKRHKITLSRGCKMFSVVTCVAWISLQGDNSWSVNPHPLCASSEHHWFRVLVDGDWKQEKQPRMHRNLEVSMTQKC